MRNLKLPCTLGRAEAVRFKHCAAFLQGVACVSGIRSAMNFGSLSDHEHS